MGQAHCAAACGPAAAADGGGAPPLAALLPTHAEFDEEAAAAAAAALPVARFAFDDAGAVSFAAPPPPAPCRGLLRCFILSSARRAALHAALAARGVHLVVSPEQCDAANLYPRAYPALAAISPRAVWVPVPRPAQAAAGDFAAAAAAVRGWGAAHVILKDYVKSAKEQTARFMQLEVGAGLEEDAADFVAARGRQFHDGVVFKEWVQLQHYPCAASPAGYGINEWRIFFGRGEVLAAVPNSFQDDDGAACDAVPPALLARAREAARAIGSPFMTVDVAETADGGWIAIEAGDGGYCAPGPTQDVRALWRALAVCFAP